MIMPHLEKEECSLSGFLIHIHCDADLHVTASGSMQTFLSSAENFLLSIYLKYCFLAFPELFMH